MSFTASQSVTKPISFRDYVHVLSMSYLEKHGYTSECGLITGLQHCRMNKTYIEIIANAVNEEAKALCLRIRDAERSVWRDLPFETPHIVACKL